MHSRAPLIVTLRFDPASSSRFDAERRRHFPADRNVVPAHLTLFHHLPGQHLEEIVVTLACLGRRRDPFPVDVTALRFMGRGFAYTVESARLACLRGELAALWAADLTAQDAAGFRPHVTIQNKVPAPQAKADFAALSAAFRPFQATATGLLLWHYDGGPWLPAAAFPFGSDMRAEPRHDHD